MKSWSLLPAICLGLSLTVLASASDDGHHINGRKVFVFETKLNWFNASDICRRNGWQLITINSVQENIEVNTLGKIHELVEIWTGATDMADNRRWIWQNNGKEVDEFFWRRNEPSNTSERRCMEVIMADFLLKWSDKDCKNNKSFICEEIVNKDDFQPSRIEIPQHIVPAPEEASFGTNSRIATSHTSLNPVPGNSCRLTEIFKKVSTNIKNGTKSMSCYLDSCGHRICSQDEAMHMTISSSIGDGVEIEEKEKGTVSFASFIQNFKHSLLQQRRVAQESVSGKELEVPVWRIIN